MKILVADDNTEGRELIAGVIATMGHEVLTVGNGTDALAQARTLLPDLIVLDVNMPGLTGFEVCKQLKAEERTGHIGILMLTALNETEDRVYGLDIGADDYLTKPFATRELIARIEKRLQAKAGADELREKQSMIRRTFERFVSPQVVERLLQDPSLVKLGGELQEVTVMFTDLEGFTKMAERTPPEKSLSVLNQYHELVVGLVQENFGTVNDFTGDGVMALFNTPLPREDHARCAVTAALAIRNALPGFHERFEPGYRMGINFGIHTGQAVVGNVGTAQTMEFTAVGDTVNTAARLQALGSHSQILISDRTYAQLAGRVAVRTMGPVQLKNRTEPVLTYEVLGWS